jgi:hypothetical protein
MKNLKAFETFNSDVNEDNIGTAFTRQGGYKFVPGAEILLDGSLFKLGVDKVDTGSEQFKKAVDALKSIGTATVEIEGGASAVGSDRGYDNEALAQRRANNFIKAAREAGVKATMNSSFKVGKSTTANSPEANAEQYVKIKYKEAPSGYTVIGIDNATVAKKPPMKADQIPDMGSKDISYKILKVVFKKGAQKEVMDELQKFGEKSENIHYLYDVSNSYNQKGYKL